MDANRGKPRLGEGVVNQNVNVARRFVADRVTAWLKPEMSERIERELPQADRVLLPESGHFSMDDRPAELAKALADWLRACA